MKATVLSDNIGYGDLSGEWGLSFFLEYGALRVLLDTGASPLFAKNAEKLGLDISQADIAVLSHAHYDHADGMNEFFRLNRKAPFYLRSCCGENCWHEENGKMNYIGMPKGILSSFPSRFIKTDGITVLADGITLVPHSTPGLENAGQRENMFVETENGMKYDSFSHEQSLVFNTARGLVIFSSCSHAGADVIIKEVSAAMPGDKVHAIVGGFHLYNKTESEVRTLAEKIQETGIEYVCTGHCTGEEAYGILREELGAKLHHLHCGLVMEF